MFIDDISICHPWLVGILPIGCVYMSRIVSNSDPELVANEHFVMQLTSHNDTGASLCAELQTKINARFSGSNPVHLYLRGQSPDL